MKKIKVFSICFLMFWLFGGTLFSQWQIHYAAGIQVTLNDVFVLNNEIIWACGSGGTVVKTTNGGLTWTTSNIGNTSMCNLIYADGINIAWVTADIDRRLYKTTNGGLNWIEVFYVSTGIENIRFFNTTTGVVTSRAPSGNDTAKIFITRNGGANWYKSLNSPVTSVLQYKSLGAIDTNFIWITDDNKCLILRNGLDNIWDIKTIDTLNPFIMGSFFINNNTGYVCDGGIATQGLKMFKTTNGGINWNVHSSDSSLTLINMLKPVNSEMVFVNGYTVIAYTRNNGLSWNRKRFAQADSIAMGFMGCYDTNSVWISANKGRLLKYNFNYIGIIPESGNIPGEFDISQNFPNPFNPATRISISLPASGDVSLLIYDINGRLTQVILQDKFLQAGVYYAEIDLKGLASGVYFYSMFFNNKTISTKKMVLVK